MTARFTSPSPDFHSPRPTVGITAPVFSAAVDDIAGSKRNLCVCVCVCVCVQSSWPVDLACAEKNGIRIVLRRY
jgi:hypothetical protein